VFVLIVALLCALSSAQAGVIGLVNAGFGTGDLTGWTLFTEANGSLAAVAGPPDVVSFNTKDSTTFSDAARFQVGQINYDPGNYNGGGGIYQTVMIGAGPLTLSADIAAYFNSGIYESNGDAGRFILLLDGVPLDTVTMGLIGEGTIIRDSLSGGTTVTAGQHEVRIEILREFQNDRVTPFQYVDNIVLDGTPYDAGPSTVPEPSSLALLCGGVVMIGLRRRRGKKAE
jgi:hypothetical protein